jgi:hypothetical protein
LNTFEARVIMRDLARTAVEMVRAIEGGRSPTPEDRLRIRDLVAQARGSLTDAGYPGEAVWRGLSRASIGMDTLGGEPDPLFWHDVAAELQAGLDTLDTLVSTDFRRESQIPWVG